MVTVLFKTPVNELPPPLLTFPLTSLNARLFKDVSFVHPDGADDCWNNILVPAGIAAKAPDIVPETLKSPVTTKVEPLKVKFCSAFKAPAVLEPVITRSFALLNMEAVPDGPGGPCAP